MKKNFLAIMVAALAMLAITPAMAQKKAPAKTPTKTSKTTPMKAADKITGGVAKDNFKYPMFEVGVSAGTMQGKRVTVDASKAKIMDKAGKFASKDGIKPGSSVTVEGKLSGTTMKAVKIQINYTPKATTPTKGTKKPMKPPVKK